ncbi:MAG: glycosyltransferase family 39 protein [Bdellovibrionales bacterium]|nr:glycosyltransferase family 39 protein [Bdellovibrionales bacterium]
MNLRNAAIIFVFSFLALALFLDRPSRLIFDEQFYVPAARSIHETGKDPNFQHPPVAKELVAVSMAAVGDTSWGWRLASVVMGAATLVAVYYLVLLFASPLSAWVAVLLVFTNGLFFTLSRLALLEIFTFGLSFIAFTFFMYRIYGKKISAIQALMIPGALFGLALAAKWSALVPIVLCVGGGVWLRRFSLSQWGFFALCVVLYYFAPFLLLKSDMSVWSQHQAMWAFHYPEVYQSDIMERTSQWWEWTFDTHPMWLAVLPNEAHESGKFLGVMIFGNPFVIWTGWLGVAACVFVAAKNRFKLNSVNAWLPAMAVAPWLVWAIAARPVTYYYYFLPTSVFLALALVAGVDVFVKRGVLTNKKAQSFLVLWAGLSLIYFLYHWPLMTGQEFSADQFQKWYPYLGF